MSRGAPRGIRRFPDPDGARRFAREVRETGERLGFVPTMGALHEGHLSLVQRAAQENERTCVSIFVNPLQFDDPEDLARYPRDFERDAELLAGAGCSAVFTGTLAQFFPEAVGAAGPDVSGAPGAIRRLDPGPFARGLEGDVRPGHFAGVATIVARLFEIVEPAAAYFGEKDFQQTLVVGDLARRLGGPRIVVCPTSRDPDGLARSSRNRRLGRQERIAALALPRALGAVRAAWEEGERHRAALVAVLCGGLEGLAVDYAVVVDPLRWGQEPEAFATGGEGGVRALAAVRIGGVRLLDGLWLDEPAPDARP